MKSSSTTFLLLLISTTTTVLTQTEGSCKNGCVSCRTNGELEWCLACSGAKHIITNITNGRCEGAPIPNCIVQSQDIDNNQLCYQCELGYAITLKEMPEEEAADGKKAHFEGYTCKKIDNSTMATTGVFYTKQGETEKFIAKTCQYGYEVNQKEDKCTISGTNSPYIEHCLIYERNIIKCLLCEGKRIWNQRLLKCEDDYYGISVHGDDESSYFNKKWLSGRTINFYKNFTTKETHPRFVNNNQIIKVQNGKIMRNADFSSNRVYFLMDLSQDFTLYSHPQFGDVGDRMPMPGSRAYGCVASVWILSFTLMAFF